MNKYIDLQSNFETEKSGNEEIDNKIDILNI